MQFNRPESFESALRECPESCHPPAGDNVELRPRAREKALEPIGDDLRASAAVESGLGSTADDCDNKPRRDPREMLDTARECLAPEASNAW